jgi:hypothetical protein
MNLLWARIYDVIIKSLMSVDTYVTQQMRKI